MMRSVRQIAAAFLIYYTDRHVVRSVRRGCTKYSC
eukprot:COSAG03_NODE_10824_length_626_cov_1.762808_1_plen_34_part_10